MRKVSAQKFKGDGDFRGLFERLSRTGDYGYKGKPKSLIESFFMWTAHHPSKSKLFNKHTYRNRAKQLIRRIYESNEYPRNYIRANDRYGMLDVIEFFSSISS